MSTIRLVNASDIFSKNEDITFMYSDSNICPICSYSSNELTAKGFYSDQEKYTNFYVLKSCPHCGRISLFESCIENYYLSHRDKSRIDLSHEIFSTYSQINEATKFSDAINNLSPNFVKIYNQSELSEQNGYNEICGMGYRKALEFLIKDYLCKIQPENSDTIKSELLSRSIDRISENRIKILAQRCAWLGNDETHYIRKHEDYDVNILKTFITSVIHHIEAELTFLSALEIQPK